MLIRKKILFCLLHGLFLTAFVLFWLFCGFFTGEDKLELKWMELTRRSLFHLDPKPVHSMAFIDVSGAKDLISDGKTPEKIVITDRCKLAAFIHNLNESHAGYKYILCDIFFIGRSNGDDSLSKVLSQTKNIVLAAQMNENRAVEPPIFDGRYGVVAYTAEDETFLKLKMYYGDTAQSLPLAMFDDMYKPLLRKKWFLHINDELFFNVQTIFWRIRPYDWQTAHNFSLYPLEHLVNLPPSVGAWQEFFHDKIVVIGDFQSDMHHTVLGDMPGAVILTNAYLSLANKDNQVTIGWVLYLIGCFTLLSWFSFYYQPGIRRAVVTFLAKYPSLKFIRRVAGYAACLYLIAIGSYILFHVFINILVLTVYFSLLNKKIIRKIIPVS